jgi:hypothetical protein
MLAERGEVSGTKFGRGWIFVTAQLIHCVLVRSPACLWLHVLRSLPFGGICGEPGPVRIAPLQRIESPE